MAGRPKQRAMVSELEKRTRAYFDVAPDAPEAPTHFDFVESYVAGGGSIMRLAKSLSTTLGFPVDRETLRRYLYTLGGEKATERMSRAREVGAHANAEESIEILDAATEDNVQLANSQARGRQWWAERANPADFGTKQGAQVSISILNISLEAMEAPLPAHLLTNAIATAIVADAEVLSISDSTT